MIYDVKTKNKSFILCSKMLRERGVKNNKFMLTLYDETLVGVDPYAKDLTPTQKFAIYRECCRNFWYFIREVVRLPADGADIPYQLNLGNMTLSYLREKNKNIILILPRQHGKTMGEAVFDVWILCFVTKNTNIVYLNKGKNDAIKNVKLFSDIKSLLPQWMLKDYIEDAKNDIDNQESKLLARRNNTIKVVAPGSDPDAADKQGRGLTVSNVIFDEFAFMKYNQITFEACLPAFKKASENAKKYGTPYGMVIVTTPNNLDVEAGAFCHSMIEQAGKWVFECFDLSDEELDNFIQTNSYNNFLFVQYNYKELGRDDEWLKQMIRECNGNLKKIKREILLEWPRSMDGAVFNEEQLDKISEFIKPVHTRILIDNQYNFEFYEMPDLNMNYILSCDVAGGLSRDNSVINIIHPEDFRIVGDFRNSKIDTDNFKKLIHKLMTFYFRNSLLVVERNSYGLNILQSLMKDPKIEPRMYKEKREPLGEKKQKDGFVVRKNSDTIIYGVETTSKSRNQMFDMLTEIVELEYDKIVSPHVYKDICSLERKRNGKIEHTASGHDDSLMAYLIFRYAVFYGNCFKDRFGIHPVPSRMNARTTSSVGDMQRIERIMTDVAEAEAQTGLYNNPMYQQLLRQEAILNKDNKSEERKQMDSFFRMIGE